MKKAYLLIIAVALSLIVFAYIRLFSTQAGYQQVLDSESGVFILENPDNADIKIITAKTDKITVNLNGPSDEIDKIRFFSTGNGSKFTFSDEWQKLSGTITVPEGTLLDIKLSNSSSITLDDSKGKTNAKKINSFLIDTNSMKSMDVDGDTNDISIDGWGDVILWDTQKWQLLTSGQNDGDASSGSGQNKPSEDGTSGTLNCTLGSQSIKNYCCERTQKDADKPFCKGYGHFIFDNTDMQCSFECEPTEEETRGTDCSIGSQQVRNNCCITTNQLTERPGCVGEWRYGNMVQACEFYCYTEEEIKQKFQNGGSGDSGQNDESNGLCSNYSTKQEKDDCCDYNLKNPLSIGPHPGFPDCIGKWYFDEEDGCQFRCAEYGEMQEILRELKENAAAEQGE